LLHTIESYADCLSVDNFDVFFWSFDLIYT